MTLANLNLCWSRRIKNLCIYLATSTLRTLNTTFQSGLLITGPFPCGLYKRYLLRVDRRLDSLSPATVSSLVFLLGNLREPAFSDRLNQPLMTFFGLAEFKSIENAVGITAHTPTGLGELPPPHHTDESIPSRGGV